LTFDTIFRVVDGSGSTANETYIIEKWGDLQLYKIETFGSNLTDPYDLENLQLSGLAIRDSLGPELYGRVSSLSTPETSGPELFKITVDQVLHMNDAQIRNFSNQLGELRLQDIPGENVAILGGKISQIAREITGSGKALQVTSSDCSLARTSKEQPKCSRAMLSLFIPKF
jgi:hypothetical protein